VDTALQELYLMGDPTPLASIIGVDNVNSQAETGDTLKDTESPVMELQTSQGSVQDSLDIFEGFNQSQSEHDTEMLLDEIDITNEETESFEVKCEETTENKTYRREQEKENNRFPNPLENLQTTKLKLEPIHSISSLLKHVKDNFLPVISAGLDHKLRSAVMTALVEKRGLSPRQGMAVLESLNIQVFKLVGRVEPDPALCRCLAKILKEKIPERFSLYEDLAEKIGESFYEKYIRTSNGNDTINSHEPEPDSANSFKDVTKKSQEDTQTSQTNIQNNVDMKRFMSHIEFAVNIEEDFESKIIAGLEASLRFSVAAKLITGERLLPKENNGVVNSVLQAILDQFGAERPDNRLCERVADVLKIKFPATYRCNSSSVQTTLGPLALPKRKGEGGYGSLARRLGDNFYNRIVRIHLRKPSPEDASEEAAIKKKRIKTAYCISKEKWIIDASANQAEKEEAAKHFLNLDFVTTIAEKKELVKASRVFIQSQFRELDPGQAVEDLQSFWSPGPEILSSWFEWLTGGSRQGSLAVTAAQQMARVLHIVEQFLLAKKGNHVVREKRKENGSDILHQALLIRQLGTFFKNKVDKLIFIDGSSPAGPEETDPNILITKQNSLGQAEASAHLRIGDKIVFSDISLAEALAGVIQIYFCFNLLYPQELDDILQVVERILCCFGSPDGARNKRNTIKRTFRDFEGFAAKLLWESGARVNSWDEELI